MKATIFVPHYIWDKIVNNIPEIPRDFFANFSPLVSLRQIRMKWPDPHSAALSEMRKAAEVTWQTRGEMSSWVH